ncbi:fimbria/pilus outer membrane usher protein [Erwinia mallotivora]|uniref:fimbria/pilus outer membrane usher protein n=1 Tax=Erwinia mallotivora TaxID=69222 RepID=UPI0021BE8648|nr:fimbria/pilus outer membrane usher protein [Erwinia mallotivora]
MKALSTLLSHAMLKALFSGAVITLLCCEVQASASFNTSLMVGDSAKAEWNDTGKTLSAGLYSLDIYVNGEWRGNLPVKIADSKTFLVQPDTIKLLSVRYKNNNPADNAEWINVSELLHGGNENLNSGLLRLNLTIPQAYIITRDRGWIAPELWDSGITGAFTNYNLNYYNSQRKDGYSNIDNIFLTLNNGLNMGGWQLLDNSTYLRSRRHQGLWTTQSRYVERALPSYRSLVRFGDSYTHSPWFENLRFRGVTLRQEQRMFPDAYRTYMPVIRGIATANALVRVYQNNTLIYQLTVPPGPFEIADLMPSGARNDLTVEVANADGTTERFIVPWSTVSDMLRTGSAEWMLNAGSVQIRGVEYHPDFVQGSASYGLNNYLTGYGGTILARDYHSLLLGSAISVPMLGSFSSSMDLASARFNDGAVRQGQRWKLSWSRFFPGNLNLSLAGWYYHTPDYYSFYDAVQVNAIRLNKSGSQTWKRSRQSFSINLDQTLPPGWGRVAMTGLWRQYWNSEQSSRQFSLSWSNMFRQANWSLAIRRSFYQYDSHDGSDDYQQPGDVNRKRYDENRIDFTVTLPFNWSGNSTSATLRSTLKNGKYNGIQTGIAGSTSHLDYHLNYSEDRADHSSVAGLWSAWRTPYARLSGNLSQASRYRQVGAGISGSAVLWQGGVLASGSSGNTFTILDAPGIADATVNGNANASTNRNGQVLVTSVTPYKMNSFRLLERNDRQDDGELKGNIGYVAPWAGSISYIRYQTDTRKVYTLTAGLANGEPLPFGADITDADGNPLGYVAQGSQLYIKSARLPESLIIRLTEGTTRKSCRIANPQINTHNRCLPSDDAGWQRAADRKEQ